MLSGTLNKIRNYLLKRKLKKTPAEHDFVNMNKVQEVAIIYDNTKGDNKKLIENFAQELKSQKKKVALMGFRKHDPKAVVDHKSFSDKQLNWLKQPKEDYLREFVNKKFDVIINTCLSEKVQIENIVALSHAKLRIGKFGENKTHCYDLMLEIKETDSEQDLLRQAEHYLNTIQ